MTDLVSYYARRAQAYERIYARPERQAELGVLRRRLAELLAGRRVLELACGTGWWTEAIAPRAAEVTALDASEAVLAIARAKRYPPARVSFAAGDCYALPDFGRRHDALLAAFWWSHVPLGQLDGFLRGAGRAAAPGALHVFIDNCYVEGSSTAISRRDAEGNTYQLRRLDDGSTHEVLKNFPGEAELRTRAGRGAVDVVVEMSRHYWLLAYRAP
ncbi:MAG: class I SAM-dependent methyltransferase [Betaproteobacteria bacterium]|nr:MAG: class I SAM-dependent methyltransferase [Betaproteobacteria bacterium]